MIASATGEQKHPARAGRVKLFGLGFLCSTVLAPALAFGLIRLAYLLLGIENHLGLEDLTHIGPTRLTVVITVALLLGALLFLLGKRYTARRPLLHGAIPLLSLSALLFSGPCLFLLDQTVYLLILDNPFAAARHLNMLKNGWGILIPAWQLLFCLGALRGSQKTPDSSSK